MSRNGTIIFLSVAVVIDVYRDSQVSRVIRFGLPLLEIYLHTNLNT